MHSRINAFSVHIINCAKSVHFFAFCSYELKLFFCCSKYHMKFPPPPPKKKKNNNNNHIQKFPHLKIHLSFKGINNIFIKKILSCISLHAISVFDKV